MPCAGLTGGTLPLPPQKGPQLPPPAPPPEAPGPAEAFDSPPPKPPPALVIVEKVETVPAVPCAFGPGPSPPVPPEPTVIGKLFPAATGIPAGPFNGEPGLPD